MMIEQDILEQDSNRYNNQKKRMRAIIDPGKEKKKRKKNDFTVVLCDQS